MKKLRNINIYRMPELQKKREDLDKRKFRVALIVALIPATLLILYFAGTVLYTLLK